MTIQFDRPVIEPQSAGPSYQTAWKLPDAEPLPKSASGVEINPASSASLSPE
jgi:hypothetical protein